MRFAFLSDKFYEDYPANRYPEIEQKRTDHMWSSLLRLESGYLRFRCVHISAILMHI